MDVAQFLEFMLGSQLAISKPGAEGVREKLLDRAVADLRDVIETTLPIIYLVKTKDIVNNILIALGSINEVEISKYVVGVEDEIVGVIGPAEPGFDEAFDSVYNEIVENYKTGAISRKLLTELNKRFSKEIDIATLGNQVSGIINTLNQAGSVFAVTESLKDAQGTQKAEAVLRTQVQQAGKDLRTYLATNTPAKFTDASQILTNFNADSEILIVGATFAGLKKTINEVCTPIIQEWFTSQGLQITTAVNAGDFTAAGHVAVKDELEQIIGINTPLTQSTLYYANQVANSNLTMDTFILDSTHIDCALVVNKEVSAGIKNLLSLNFSFVVSQETTFNSVTLRTAEVSAMNSIVDKVFKTTRDNLKSQFLKNIVSKKGLTYLISALKFSPTLSESIALQLAAELSGKPKDKLLAIAKAKNIGKSSGVSATKLAISKTINKVSKNSSTSSTAQKRKQQNTTTFSLVNLQNLINSQLQETIRKNMGTGRSSNVLNYRSGRFAASVQVERLTQSRQGMITVFYSYMKNPYQTFEPGFAQGSPESRSPKLLISKSIREIAAAQVTSQLRAVSV